MLATVGVAGPTPGMGANASPRLVHAAHEFEAQMMKELLKPLREGDGDSIGDSEEGSAGVLGEFASEALGMAVSNQGGLGVARSLLRSLSHSETAGSATPGSKPAQKETH